MIIGGIANDIEAHQITSGVVADKSYTTPYTTYSTSSNGDTTVSIPVHHDASYRIYIQGDNGHSAWFTVTPLVYDRIKIGDHFTDVKKEIK